MDILITGGAGFIGSTLADRLLGENHRLCVVDNFDNYYDSDLKEQNVYNNLKNTNYRLYRTDICDTETLENIFRENRFDLVIHMAAKAGVRASIEKPLESVSSNIYGTVNVLEQMKNFGIKKIIFASSSSVYGNCNENIFSEDLKISEPISPYAASKLACEQFIYTYSNLYDINAICLRFFTVYGPRQRPDLAIRKFVELIEQEKPIPVYGDGTTIRDYTYIDDIIDGICSAIEYNKTKYEIINLAGGNPITLNEMISDIEEVMGKKAVRNYLPMAAGDVNKTAGDITKAKHLLGYNPKISFKEGLLKFISRKSGVNTLLSK